LNHAICRTFFIRQFLASVNMTDATYAGSFETAVDATAARWRSNR
jgi:hypothetical protein